MNAVPAQRPPAGHATTTNLLPGPVKIALEVHEAFARPPTSHRSREFIDELVRTRTRLCQLTGARHVAVLVGSGTLANDVLAAQLRPLGHGLVLTNGEFGERIVDHAKRAGLHFDVLDGDWGAPLPYDAVRQHLARRRHDRPGWMWAIHCETSTGVLNDPSTLAEIADTFGMRLCLDAISSIGTTPVDLSGVHLATGVSGKGLASYPGLALVFHDRPVATDPDLPRYLDLGAYSAVEGVPFTSSSNLLWALARSLDRFASAETATRVFDAKVELARWLRAELGQRGLAVMASADVGSPAVITIVTPPAVDSLALGERLDEAGFYLSYRSKYLVARGLIQICLMSDHSRAELAPALDAISSALDAATAEAAG